jgi:hypothetical protein
MFFEIRNLWSSAPRLRVWHWHGNDWRSKKDAKAAYARRPADETFRRIRDGAVFERPMRELAIGDDQAVTDAIARRMAALVDARAFERDIRYQQKYYS